MDMNMNEHEHEHGHLCIYLGLQLNCRNIYSEILPTYTHPCADTGGGGGGVIGPPPPLRMSAIFFDC